jgi:hypothetical protein
MRFSARTAFSRDEALAALDLATGKPFYRIRPRKRALEFLAFLKTLRARWAGEKLYVICNSYSPLKGRVSQRRASGGLLKVYLSAGERRLHTPRRTSVSSADPSESLVVRRIRATSDVR